MSIDTKTEMNFDTSDKPSMGDPEFVDSQVRAMGDDLRKALFEAPSEDSNPQVAVQDIAKRYADEFYAGNADYIQTLTPEAQSIWLRQHGLGDLEPAEDFKAPVTCLVAATLKQLVNAMQEYAQGNIDEEQLQFRLDIAVEDCVAMLLGIENPAD